MPGPLFLDGDRVELRTIEREDLEFAQESLKDPEVRVGLGVTEPQTLAGDFSGEDGDTPTRVDSAWRITGETGAAPENAGPTTFLGDRFLLTGSVSEFELSAQDQSTEVNVYLDEALATRDDVLALDSS